MCIPIGIFWSCGCDWRAWWPCSQTPCPLTPAIIHHGELPPKPTPEPSARFRTTQYASDIRNYRNYLKRFATFLQVSWCCAPECCKGSISRCLESEAYNYRPEMYNRVNKEHLDVCLTRFSQGFGLLNHLRRTDQPRSDSGLLINDGIDPFRYYLAVRGFYLATPQDRKIVAGDGWTPPADLVGKFEEIKERSGQDQAAQIYLDWNLEPVRKIEYILSALILDITRDGKRKPNDAKPTNVSAESSTTSGVSPTGLQDPKETALQTFDLRWLGLQPKGRQFEILKAELVNIKKRMEELAILQVDLALDNVAGLGDLSDTRELVDSAGRWTNELRSYCSTPVWFSINQQALLRHACSEADYTITFRKAELDRKLQVLRDADPDFHSGETRLEGASRGRGAGEGTSLPSSASGRASPKPLLGIGPSANTMTGPPPPFDSIDFGSKAKPEQYRDILARITQFTSEVNALADVKVFVRPETSTTGLGGWGAVSERSHAIRAQRAELNRISEFAVNLHNWSNHDRQCIHAALKGASNAIASRQTNLEEQQRILGEVNPLRTVDSERMVTNPVPQLPSRPGSRAGHNRSAGPALPAAGGSALAREDVAPSAGIVRTHTESLISRTGSPIPRPSSAMSAGSDRVDRPGNRKRHQGESGGDHGGYGRGGIEDPRGGAPRKRGPRGGRGGSRGGIA